MGNLLLFITLIMGVGILGFKTGGHHEIAAAVIVGNGQMPNATGDKSGNIHIAFGRGDSIMYSSSTDQGKSFSVPALVSLLPELVASHTRGPQITYTAAGLTVIACDNRGNIFSFMKTGPGSWQPGFMVNDVDTVAKEGLMALGGDGQITYAVWLDLRSKHNKIFGASSTNGGKIWSPNKMIYSSPDTTVCECCKPSVVVKRNNVFVMFRNWLKGNRDIYLIQSTDGGNTFGQAKKLGNGSWSIKGCPMDGGGIAIDKNGGVQTVWRRESRIYSCQPGKQETELAVGRSCTIESINGRNVYAWTEKGEIIIMIPNGTKSNLGKGAFPIVKAVNSDQVICVWENEKKILASVVEL